MCVDVTAIWRELTCVVCYALRYYVRYSHWLVDGKVITGHRTMYRPHALADRSTDRCSESRVSN